ncbi:MAG: DUF2797 domain-containing protein [Crocinitomicaceae bacterium]
MKFEGNLKKMRTSLENDEIHYTLDLNGDAISINDLIGSQVEIIFEGRINCIACGSETKKSFGGGFCYSCFTTAPEASPCIIHPELCEAHLGGGRDPEWEATHHNRPHFVYLAVSSAIKVGITRKDQIPTRWIDQGANYAIKLAEVPYRQLAGQIEVALKEVYTDKTNWRKMLTNDYLKDVDLVEEKWALEDVLPADLLEYFTEDDEITFLHYPVIEYPTKAMSLNLDKNPAIIDQLQGIKGQYLLFKNIGALNIRKHSGYYIQFST